jgi:plasmid stabilization system protein ParE
VARVRWSKQALADLEAIGDFIARDTPSVAQVFVERMFAAAKRFEAFPFSQTAEMNASSNSMGCFSAIRGMSYRADL